MSRVYYCGPQAWPVWVRKILSRYYNRPCRNHDNNYSNPAVSFEESEKQFTAEVRRRRGVLKKAYKRGKLSYFAYNLHGRLLGLNMARLTLRYGRHYEEHSK